MIPFKIIEVQKGTHFEYHVKGTRRGFIRENLFTDAFYKYSTDQFVNWLNQNNITSLATMEDSLLYSILLQHLIKNNSCLFTYFDSKDEILRMGSGLASEKCEWRYSIEYTRDSEDSGDLNDCMDFGFLNPEEFLNRVNYSNKDLSNRYFYLSKINEAQIGSYIQTYHSDVSNWNFCFFQGDQEAEIKELLCRRKERPALDDLLRKCASLVCLQVGEDEGYVDYVLMLSRVSMKEVVSRMEQSIVQFIKDYEALVGVFHSLDTTIREEYFMKNFMRILEKANRS